MIFHVVYVLSHVSFVLSQITCLTDRQTDGRTDTFLVAGLRWHFMQRGKKCKSHGGLFEKSRNSLQQFTITFRSKNMALTSAFLSESNHWLEN